MDWFIYFNKDKYFNLYELRLYKKDGPQMA